MNVGELKKMLDQYPDDMPVIKEIYSDYQEVEPGQWSIEEAVFKGSECYYMRPHMTMSDENKANIKKCLCLEGN